MKDPHPSSDQSWQPAENGVLQSARRDRVGKAKKQRLYTVSGTAAAVLAVVVFMQLPKSSPGTVPNYGGLTCDQVATHMESYLANTLNEDVAENVTQHLEDCPVCAMKYSASVAVDDSPTEVPEYQLFSPALLASTVPPTNVPE